MQVPNPTLHFFVKKLSVCFAVIVFVSFVSAQKPAQPRSIPDKALVAKLDNLFKELNNTSSPGCAVTVIKDGRILASRYYGMASLEHQVSFTHQNVVRIPYSEGREFISTASVLMEQDGLLKLDDKVRKYFPRLPDWSEPVTVWDLLNHRSGFVDEWANILLTQASMENRFDRSQFLNLLYTQPVPEIEPGKGYMYSNSDFGLLRLILEKASGQDLAAWMEKRIFAPLKMNSTRLHNDAFDVIPRFAKTYYRTSDNKYKLQWTDKSSPGGNYFIATNAGDLALWAAALQRADSDVAGATARLVKCPANAG